MSLYFTFEGKTDGSAVICSKWHPTIPTLAVATSSGKVNILGEEGDSIIELVVESDSSITCSALDWNPVQKVLCVGWKDGSISMLIDSRESRDTNTPHKGNAITAICWSESGDKVLTGDLQGNWCVWRFDKKLLLAVGSKESLDGGLTHMTFRTKPQSKRSVKEDVEMTEEEREDKATTERLMIEDEDDGLSDFKHGTVMRFNENCTWFVGGSSGNVWGIDGDGTCCVIFSMDGQPITSLIYHPARTGVVAMNQNSGVSYYTMSDDHRWSQQARFRISVGKGANTSTAHMIWVGRGLIATCAGETLIRVWNIDENENYVISADAAEGGEARVSEKVTAIAYNPRKRVLCGGTRSGKVIFWQYSGGDKSTTEDDWDVLAEVKMERIGVSELVWGPGDSLLSAAHSESVVVLHGTALKRKLFRNTAIIQLTPTTLLYQDLGANLHLHATATIRVKGVDLAGSHFVVWNSKQVELFHIQMSGIQSIGVIEVQNSSVALHTEKLMVTRTERGVSSLELYNTQLQKLSHLSVKAHEGEAVQIAVNSDYLVAATSKNYLSCWWIGGRAGEDKPHRYPKLVWDSDQLSIAQISVNCNGSKVAVLAKKTDSLGQTTPDQHVYVCDLEHDKTTEFNLADICRTPTSVFWDETEPKLLACEATRTKKQPSTTEEQTDTAEGIENQTNQNHNSDDTEELRTEVVTFFASQKGVKLQDQFPLDKSMTALIGLGVPNFYFYSREGKRVDDKNTNVITKVMRDFEGIDCTDPRIREALLDFSFNLACGDMDAAYRSVKLIKDENVWTNMAQMCVKTGRLDVAEVCLGNMQDAKGARALREAKKEPEQEAHIAMLALQLGLIDDAERLYKKCGRYDLLNSMHQACGRWETAISLAEEHDRIHLRSIHYSHARHLESLGKLHEATAAYEKAKCHGYEVPRMYNNAGMLEELECYVVRSEDSDVQKWWAQFCESIGQNEQALHFYKKAGDTLSRIRLHCYLRDMDTAVQIVQAPENASTAAAAAYHLARQFEEAGKMKETLQFYRVAKAYRNAIRIARTNDMEGEVMQLSLQADQATIIESAQWFEEQNMLDKAVILYKKGGELSKALDLCIRGELYETLQKLADDLDKEADPDVFIQCAEFFLSKDQNEKAVDMYIQAKGYSEALQACLDCNVKLTDEMAEEMTLPKTDNEDDEALRLSLLRKIAKVAKLQESWHLACKKYTQVCSRGYNGSTQHSMNYH
eukprot:TRINITY_DN2605_c0_g1_i2.p1 TRINITY_DN2605_c0_g1~~TRINITY_DN2605_c0_g1_i2.p1  ORF type:complete len:1224 (+),score=242.12 TRINITY_DN2605_c0_g1_i2:66-3737(+)